MAGRSKAFTEEAIKVLKHGATRILPSTSSQPGELAVRNLLERPVWKNGVRNFHTTSQENQLLYKYTGRQWFMEFDSKTGKSKWKFEAEKLEVHTVEEKEDGEEKHGNMWKFDVQAALDKIIEDHGATLQGAAVALALLIVALWMRDELSIDNIIRAIREYYGESRFASLVLEVFDGIQNKIQTQNKHPRTFEEDTIEEAQTKGKTLIEPPPKGPYITSPSDDEEEEEEGEENRSHHLAVSSDEEEVVAPSPEALTNRAFMETEDRSPGKAQQAVTQGDGWTNYQCVIQ